MIRIKSITKNYDGNTILDGISFEISNFHKIAIVGSNGVGKSVLLKIIAGIIEPDSGVVEGTENKSIGYLPQECPKIDTNLTVKNYLKKKVGIFSLEKELLDLEKKLDNDENIKKYSKVQEKYMFLGGYDFEHEAKKIKNGLGLEKISFDRKIGTLSGGERVKIDLVGILLKGRDLIILDEPTNNLDFKAIKWLENYLANISATCIIVSHDRYFLDKIVNEIVEIDWFSRTVKTFTGSYSYFIEYKKKQYDKKLKQYEDQQTLIAGYRKTIDKKKSWNISGSRQNTTDNDKYQRGYNRDRSSKLGKSAKALEKRIEQIDTLDKPQKKDDISILIDPPKDNPNSQIIIKDMIAGYDKFEIGPINLEIKYGDRIIIVGNNGSGKTTLLNAIYSKEDIKSGLVQKGKQVKIGYLKQKNTIKDNVTVGEYLSSQIKLDKQYYYHALIKFGFSSDIYDREFNILSPGERARIILASFSLREVNTLLLDEPTNHLDIDAQNALEQIVKKFNGTIISVSHDRYFIDVLRCNNLYKLESGKIKPIKKGSL